MFSIAVGTRSRSVGGLKPQTINRVSLLLLVLGFGSAVAIWFAARPAEGNPLGDQLGNKKFVHELRVWGGQGNVMAAEFTEWFKARWEGQNLAVTVAVLTTLATLAFRFVAARPDLWRDPPAANQIPPAGRS